MTAEVGVARHLGSRGSGGAEGAVADSSDSGGGRDEGGSAAGAPTSGLAFASLDRSAADGVPVRLHQTGADDLADAAADRSEEHTSELQSLMRISYAVFCLKKKKIKP